MRRSTALDCSVALRLKLKKTYLLLFVRETDELLTYSQTHPTGQREVLEYSDSHKRQRCLQHSLSNLHVKLCCVIKATAEQLFLCRTIVYVGGYLFCAVAPLDRSVQGCWAIGRAVFPLMLYSNQTKLFCVKQQM